MNHTCESISRDTRDYKSRIEAYSREMLRKEAQIKDLQSRAENGDGSKYLFSNILSCLVSFYQIQCPCRSIFLSYLGDHGWYGYEE